jgi:hypothetical protein
MTEKRRLRAFEPLGSDELHSGVRAIDVASDVASRLMRGSTRDGSAHPALYRALPARADRVELAILTALAERYGCALLTHASLGYALRMIAERGGVAVVQRVLWSESAADAHLCVTLTAAQAAFTEISLAFPDAFFAEASALIAACCPFTPQRRGLPSSNKGDPDVDAP